MKTFLVSGGAGFIGSHFIRSLLKSNYKVINYDLLTYASSLLTIKEFKKDKNYKFVKGDITNNAKIKKILYKFNPDFIINFAAETHVDRSIDKHSKFINTNILGVFNLMDCALNFWQKKKINLDLFKFLLMKYMDRLIKVHLKKHIIYHLIHLTLLLKLQQII